MPLRPYPVPMPSCSPHLMQIGYSVQRGGRGALPRLLSPASRRVDSRAGRSGGWKAAETNEERKRRAGGLFSGRHPLSRRRASVGRGMQKGTGTGHGRRCALASARMTGRGILPHVDRAPGSARGGGARKGRGRPTRLNAIRPALFVRGDSLWIPAATYLPGPSPAKYCRRMRA